MTAQLSETRKAGWGVSEAALELADFLDENVPLFLAEWGEDRSMAARLAWQRRLAAGNWVAPSWPVEIGGRGLGVADRVACDLALGRRKVPPVAGILGVLNVGPTLAAWGNAEQRRSLPRILDGTEIWCQGFSEPEAGSDLASLRMSAVRDGEDFILNGQKIWTSQGMEATHCQLLVRTDLAAKKHKGISALAIPLDLPGIDRRPLRQLTGEADFAEVFFTDVRVPTSCLLGPENAGWTVTMTTLAHERAGVISVVARLESDVSELVDEHRYDGPSPLSEIEQDELVQRYVQARVLAMMGENSLRDAEAGGAPGPEQSLIKLAWGQLSQSLSRTRLALSGPAGLAPLPTELALSEAMSPSAHSYFLARSSTIAGGTTEVMKNILAERVLGLPKDPS